MNNAVCYFFAFLIEAVILWQYSSNLFTARRRPWIQFAILFIFYFAMFVISKKVLCFFLIQICDISKRFIYYQF